MNKYLKILIFFIFFIFAFLISPEFKYNRVCADQNNPFTCENKWKIDYKNVRFTGGADIIKFATTGKPINEDYVPVTPITLISSTLVALLLSIVTIKLIERSKNKKPKAKE